MKTRGRNTSQAQQQQEESTRGGATSSSSAANRWPSTTSATGNASMNHDEMAHSDISLNLDTMGRERSSTLGSFRDRGLTLGSEFDDLGLTLGLDTTQAAASAQSTSVSGAHPDAIEFHPATGVASSSSQRNRTTSTSSAMDYLGMLGQAASALAQHSEDSATALNQQSQQKHLHPPQSNELKQTASSLSSSKRIRSMSDLEDRGIIDKQQKGLLKDLIISGKGDNNELQKALDAYEKGDTSALEHMIKTGALNAKNRDDIDLLVDMDLDFLSMGASHGETANEYGKKGTHHVPGVIQALRSLSNPGSGSSTPNIRGGPSPAPSHHGYDGMVDLDFNADYGNPHHSTGRNRADSLAELQRVLRADSMTDTNPRKPRSDSLAEIQRILRSDSISDVQRMRANSLAFGGLLDDLTAPHDSFGNWTDRTPEEGSRPLKKRMGSFSYPGPERNEESNKKLTKAEIKKREREQKKALREAAKLEKKREKEAKSKNKAKIKQEKKTKKSENLSKKRSAASQEEYYSENEEYDGLGDDNEEQEYVVVSGSGRPRSLSDPNIQITFDTNGLMSLISPPDWVGAYSPRSRKLRVQRFVEKRDHRVWVKKVKYDVRKNFADSRLRVKGRFVKKEDESLMRDLMSLT
jgi:hypothetical protein